jgi:2-methylcitrate dehydratase PrpD
MLKLTREQLVNAFGIAASEASGIKGNFGTMTKSLHAGRAAAKGIFAAKMGQLGYGANARIMEIVGGFPDVTTGEMSAEAMIARMNDGNSVFLSPGLTMKPYPCCKCNQNAIDAIFNLMDKYKFQAEAVDKIVCGVQPFFIDVLKYPQATTPLEGKFSMSYNLAISILHGTRPAIKDYEGTKITDDKTLALMKKIEMVVDPSIANGAYANGTWDTIVKVTLTDGRVLEERVKHSRGESANPLTTDEVVEKLKDCMAVTLDMSRTEPVIELVKDLEKLATIKELMAAIETAASK